MTVELPRLWASDTNYTNGSAAGTPTKTDPGAALSAEGFVPGRAGAQHLNYNLNKMSFAARQLLARAALQLVPADNTLTSEAALAAASVGASVAGSVLVLKSGASNVKQHTHTRGISTAVGTVASITSLVTDIAVEDISATSHRLMAIGTGGNRAAFSTDNGATWAAAGANLGFTPRFCTFMALSGDKWFVPHPTSTTISVSADDGGTWNARASNGLALCNGGVAPVSGAIVVCGETGAAPNDPAFTASSDGVTFAMTSGTVADPTTYDDAGTMVGFNNQLVHVGRRNAGATMRVSLSSDGSTWTTAKDISPPANTTFVSKPRVLACRNTGLYVIVAPNSVFGANLYASFDGGETWTEDNILGYATNTAAYALAGGVLWMTSTTLMFASMGIE